MSLKVPECSNRTMIVEYVWLVANIREKKKCDFENNDIQYDVCQHLRDDDAGQGTYL